jgi:hypothetical protein
LNFFLWLWSRIFRIAMVLGCMGIGPLDLYEAFGTYWLIAAACFIEIRRVKHEADGALLGVFV